MLLGATLVTDPDTIGAVARNPQDNIASRDWPRGGTMAPKSKGDNALEIVCDAG